MFVDRQSLPLAGLLATVALIVPLQVRQASGGFSKVELGGSFPTLQGKNADGASVSTREYGDRILLLAFVRTNQELSLRVLRDLQAVQVDLELGGVNVLAIVSTSEEAPWDKVAEKNKLTLPVLLDPKESLASQCGLVAYPTTAFLGVGGVLSSSMMLHDFDYRQDVLDEVRALQSHKGGVLPPEELEKRRSAERLVEARRSREAGDLEGALRLVEELVSREPTSFRLQLEKGDLALEVGKASLAAEAYEKARGIHPNSTKAQRGLGLAWAKSGESERALTLLEEVAKVDPRPGLVHREISRLYRAKGDAKKALEHAKLALRHVRRGIR